MGIWGWRFFSLVQKVPSRPFSPKQLFQLLAGLKNKIIKIYNIKIIGPKYSFKENAEKSIFHYMKIDKTASAQLCQSGPSNPLAINLPAVGSGRSVQRVLFY